MSQLLFIFMKGKFIDLCKYGNIKEAKLLYDINNININSWNDQAFRFACANGHLEIAKWLYSLGSDINARNDLAFELACENGNLEIAKWLHGLGADIHAFNDEAFRKACQYGHFNVVDWLLTIGDFHVKDILNSYNFSSEINKLLKQHLEYKLKWCNLFWFNKKCTKKFSDMFDNSKKEYSKTFDDMFPFSKVKN